MGDDPTKARLREIRTENYIFIYPQEIDSLARRYATLFEANRERVMEPLEINPKRIPVVLHPYYTRSNGVVTWTPKRVDIFTTPPPYEGTAEPWDVNVSIHESRHIGQVSHFETGVYKVLYPLIGEQSTGIGVGLYPSKAFLEGDAVIAETELTNAGRGRNADFMMYLRAAYLNGDYRDWDKWNFGSYKYFTPDHYAIGYVINTAVRHTTANYHYPSNYLKYIVKHFYNPNVIFNSFNTIGGKSKQLFLVEGQRILTEIWKKDLENIGELTQGERICVKQERLYTDYRYPIVIDDTLSKYHNHTIAVKEGFERSRSLVAINNKTGKEKIIRAFSNYSSPLALSTTGEIYWSESLFNGVDALRDNSVICSFDTRKGGSSIQKFGTRYFNPVPSPSGDNIAVVEYPVSGSSYLVLLTSGQQHAIGKVEAPNKGQIKEIAYIGEIIYCSVIMDKGLGIYRFTDNGWEEVIPQQNQTITGMKSYGDNLYFTSDLSGINNIYTFDTSENKLYKLTNSLYGASDGYIHDGYLCYSEFDTQGYHLARTPLDELYNKEVSFETPYKHPIAEMLSEQASQQTKINTSEVTDFSDPEKYPSKRYSKLAHLFRIHSWGPVYYNVDRIMSMSYEKFYDLASLGATVYSQNTLGTAVTMLGYSYHKGFHSGHAKFTYSGLPVNIEIGADYNDRNRRSQEIILENGTYTLRTTEHLHTPFLKTYALLYLPWNLTRGGWNRGLVPQFQWTFTNDTYYSKQKGDFVYKHQLNYGLKYYQTLPVTKSGFYPRWGFGLSFMGGAAPGTGENFGNMIYANGYFYFPGITPQQGLKITATAQKQNVEGKSYYLSSFASLPRGYKNISTTEEFIKATLDYAIPIYLGDYNLWSILYFKRMTLIPFADYALDRVPGVRTTQYYSFGSDILFDIYPFRFNVPVSLGMRYAYTGPQGPDVRRHRFEFLFSLDLP